MQLTTRGFAGVPHWFQAEWFDRTELESQDRSAQSRIETSRQGACKGCMHHNLGLSGQSIFGCEVALTSCTASVYRKGVVTAKSDHDKDFPNVASLVIFCTFTSGVISKVRTLRTNERTLIWEVGDLDPIRCAIDRKITP